MPTHLFCFRRHFREIGMESLPQALTITKSSQSGNDRRTAPNYLPEFESMQRKRSPSTLRSRLRQILGYLKPQHALVFDAYPLGQCHRKDLTGTIDGDRYTGLFFKRVFDAVDPHS